jgi:hypothetical protein
MAITHQSSRTSIRPDWNEIKLVRESTADFLRGNGFEDDTVNAILMVSNELTENAVKYGCFRDLSPSILHCISVAGGRITVEVTHPLGQLESSQLKRLDQQVQWIRGFQNRFEAYLEKLKDISSRDLCEGESGLGLVRIAYEGQAVLDFYLSDEGNLCVSAVHTLA